MGKRDYSNPAAKLKLRRHFIRKYHADDPPAVFDAVAGEAGPWVELRRTEKLASYWGVDLAPKAGRLRLDAVRVLSQAGWPYTVIDIDTTGQPWKEWLALLPNVSRPTSVFMTLNRAKGGRKLSDIERDALGLNFPTLQLPPAFSGVVTGRSLYPLLKRAEAFALVLVDVQLIRPRTGGMCVGVHLYPTGVPKTAPPEKTRKRFSKS